MPVLYTSILRCGCNKTVRVQRNQTISSQLSPESDARGYKISYDSKLLPVLHTSKVCSGRGGGESAVQKLRSSTPVAVALGDTRKTFTHRRYSTHQWCVAAAVRYPCPRALTVLTAAIEKGDARGQTKPKLHSYIDCRRRGHDCFPNRFLGGLKTGRMCVSYEYKFGKHLSAV